MASHSVVLFYSSTHAIRAEKVMVKAGIQVKMIPTPRHLSSDCGMALRFDRVDEAWVAEELADKGVPVNGIHAL